MQFKRNFSTDPGGLSQPTSVAISTDLGGYFNRPRWLFQPTSVAISTDPGGWHSPFFSYCEGASCSDDSRVISALIGVSPDVPIEAARARAAPGMAGR